MSPREKYRAFLTHIESFLNYRNYRNVSSVKSVAHMNMFFWRINEIILISTKGCIKSTSALKLFIQFIRQSSLLLNITAYKFMLKNTKNNSIQYLLENIYQYVIAINGWWILDTKASW